jgi:hypothetical protein
MSFFSGLFAGLRTAPNDGVRPQYLPGVAPAGSMTQAGMHNPNLQRHHHTRGPAVVTSGFDDSMEQQFHLSYGLRAQPDVGGALNFAFENYGIPLVQPGGAFMVARHPIPPIGNKPLAFYPQAVPTGLGLVPGQMISQPLLNPQGPNAGIDIYD